MQERIKKVVLDIIGKGEPSAHSKFESLMRWADKLFAQRNVEGLRDLIKIVLRPVQAKHMSDAYLTCANGAIDGLGWVDALNITGEIDALQSTFLKYVCEQGVVSSIAGAESLNLASDIVLPTVWHSSSVVQMLGQIGRGLECGAFEQSENHQVTYMHPLCIGWVTGGNHSISQAIVRGDGSVKPSEYLDVSAVVQAVRFDGTQWRCIASGRSLGRPQYVEFGWVWELGRMISDLSPDVAVGSRN
ncbi:DUF6710 family protein [Pseudomonas sp. MWU12-2345]|uniref:DUF6710 family protein n=1 Tax=Pseudomonas sp. MWU12-2345 TaxID=2928689 RepID=UPI00200E3214|nr:DUF6710 family protein [Pseudomonas sp. MWU12-2345]